MKLHCIYFSPTGGTERVVRLLAEAWDEPAQAVDLSLTDGKYGDRAFPPEDLCLIAVPSFGGRVPAVALQRLGQMKADGTNAVLVVAYGNRAYDDTLLELEETARQIGFHVVAAVAAVTEHSIMHQFAAGRPDEADQTHLRAFGRQIKEKLAEHTALSPLALPGNQPYREYHGVPFKPEADKSCTDCGICAARCPVGAIPVQTPSQTDKTRCISCMRCMAVCPPHARKLNTAVLFVAGKKMEKVCSVRKEAELFLG
ncbi:MAG: 4Fe-4S binding protein [Oscillibacter sp.]